MRPLSRRTLPVVPVLFCLLLCGPRVTAAACPFCPSSEPPLIEDFRQAPLVVLGKFVSFKPGPGGDGVYELEIERVIKAHGFVEGKRTLTLDRGAPPGKSKFIVFIDVVDNRPDAYRGVESLPGSSLLAYLTKALELKDRPQPERLRHCFDYLASGDEDASADAYREFARADYKDYKDMAKNLPADKIAGWLLDPNTSPMRYGLYGSLLGHCGDPAKHGPFLKKLCDDPQKRASSSYEGLLAGLVMLQPKEGWQYVRNLLKDGDPDSFELRFAALRAARFFSSDRSDLVDKGDVVLGLLPVLEQADMADFVIDDYRRWQRWEFCDRILDLFQRESHNLPVVRRAILRYALQCPQPRAAAFVREQRQRDAEWVADAEELLRLEAEPTPDPKKK